MNVDQSINESINESITFVDCVKNKHTCTVSTCQRLMNTKKFYCFWCKISYRDVQPVHCPIKYYPKQAIKQYENSHILKGNVEEDSVEYTEQGYYEVDGSFCSWSCVLAFIRENKQNPLYTHSEQLMYKIRNNFDSIVIPSPHWRLLDIYGGKYTKEEMKKKIGKDNYQDFHYIVFQNYIFEKKLC